MRSAVVWIVLIGCTSAFAESPGTVEIRASLGYTGFVDESLIAHLQTGGSSRLYLTRRLSIEPEFQYLRGSGGHYDLAVTPNVNWDFREGRVVPYVTAGYGWLRTYEPFSQGRVFVIDQSFFQVGAGVKLYLTDRWYVAPEFRAGSELHGRLSAALGFRLR